LTEDTKTFGFTCMIRQNSLSRYRTKKGKIVLDYEKMRSTAEDSTGKLTQYPNFKQGSNVVEPDSIRFNFN
jgi:hypothetical protein